MNDSVGRSKFNIWVAVAGATLLAVLSLGLLLGGANAQTGRAGYGATGNGKPRCVKPATNGYGQPCASQVSAVTSKPGRPIEGRGFRVSFKSTSGGAYVVEVVRNGTSTMLERGATGAGKTRTAKVGQALDRGKYKLRVTVTSDGTPDSAKRTLRIKRK